jgi:cysteine synthase A
MAGAIEEARRIAAQIPGAIILGQFSNEANPRVHEKTTAKEIWDDTDGSVDIVVAGIGTGGTSTGLARYLKKRKPGLKVIGVEPSDSPFLTKGHGGPHKIQGIGAGFRPTVLELERLDEVVTVSGSDAARWMRHLARHEGIFAGISSGAALAAALAVSRRDESKGAVIVVMLPDGGEKYLSSDMWGDADDPRTVA